MTLQKLIKKTIFSIIGLAIILIIVGGFFTTANVMINNYLALGQLENDDTMFMFMQLYNNTLKPIVKLLVVCIASWTVIKILFNINKYLKNNSIEED